MKFLTFGATGAFGTAWGSVLARNVRSHVGLSHTDIDITDTDQLARAFQEHRPDVVVNAVALVGINPCEQRPIDAFKLHSIAVAHLARLCALHGATFIQLSTHAVFDGIKDGFYLESDQPNPTGIYAASKYAGELLASNICSAHYVVRLPCMFGPRQNLSLGFVDKVVASLTSGATLKIAADKIDSPSYTMDLAQALLEIVDRSRPFGLYHLANVGAVSLFDFVVELASIANFNIRVVPAKDADFPALADKPLKTAMSSAKLPKLRSWKVALRDYVKTDLGL
jgi:dTDP-4-dehydrorhamnose reductase